LFQRPAAAESPRDNPIPKSTATKPNKSNEAGENAGRNSGVSIPTRYGDWLHVSLPALHFTEFAVLPLAVRGHTALVYSQASGPVPRLLDEILLLAVGENREVGTVEL
jgi:hypothetical protein